MNIKAKNCNKVNTKSVAHAATNTIPLNNPVTRQDSQHNACTSASGDVTGNIISNKGETTMINESTLTKGEGLQLEKYRKPDGKIDWQKLRNDIHEKSMAEDENNFAPYNVPSSLPGDNNSMNNNNVKIPQNSYRVQSILTRSMFNRRFDDIVILLKAIGIRGAFQRETLLKLIDYLIQYGPDNVFPSVPKLVDELHVSERTIQYSLAKLEELGLGERQARHYQNDAGEVKQRSNKYRLDKLVLLIIHDCRAIGRAAVDRIGRLFDAMKNFYDDIWDPDVIVNITSCFVVRKIVI